MDDYKEKYKQAVKKIKDLFNEGEQKGFTIITYRKDFEKIFPELKESEDERIRKAILELVRQSSEVLDRQNQNNMIAWLEKQGEQKPTEWKQENREELTEFENAMMHIGDSFFGENAGLDPNNTVTIKEQAELLLELVPSKEWSEEDERNLQGIIDEINANKNNAPDYDLATYDRFLSWIKSLKERIGGKAWEY